jgi:primosomal protein N' (replication factor Y)
VHYKEVERADGNTMLDREPGAWSPRYEGSPAGLRPAYEAGRGSEQAPSAGTQFAEVAVTLPVFGRFHYVIPECFKGCAQVGARVLVRFGPRKVTGVVVRADTTPPSGITPVALSDVLDDEPSLSAELVELCLWIADYYEAPPGEVIRAALPAGSGVAARSVFALTRAGREVLDGNGSAMLPRQRALLARLGPRDLPAAGLSAAIKRQLAQLVAHGLVEQREQRDPARVRLKRERVVQLTGDAGAARALVARAPRRLAETERSPEHRAEPDAPDQRSEGSAESDVRGGRMKHGLRAVIERLASGAAMSIASLDRELPKAKAAVRELAKLGLVTVSERELPVDAVSVGEDLHVSAPPVLTEEQRIAVDEITLALRERAEAPGASPAEGVAETERSPEHRAKPEAPEQRSEGSAKCDVRGGRMKYGLRAETEQSPEHRAKLEAPDQRSEGSAGSDVRGGRMKYGLLVPGRGSFTPFLLHGVTGSGKTEVYLRVIATALEAGRTALVLVPEISLTPQLAARFRARFGDLVAILHSGLSERARLGEWSRLRRGEARIAVGARSAVFAPLAGLGVIVVDEEHDGSFKQDEGVRYHARDVALVRAQRAGAVCVLGSATPSLESAAHAERGAYRKLTLTERPTARPMPSVEIIDLRIYVPDGDAMLSAPLRTAIDETLAAGDQTILFLNRRGFATFVLCRACGHAFRCPHCSVSLTYHRHSDRLSCHYCGFAQRVPDVCPSCGATETIERKGLGTEKVADAIATAFPAARVARLDRDVATGAKVEAVLARVARREVDVLVGTQMVTKGHDFPGVTLVGVLCADTGLNLPDFRASERTFQLLAQVAGRAGRGGKPGRVMIQTYRPRAPAVVAAAAHDYAGFFAAESAARAELGYPPHGRLIAVRVDGADAHEVAGVAQQLAQLAQAAARQPGGGQVEVRGPVPAPIERLRNRTRWQVWLRSSDRHALRRVARSLLVAGVVALGPGRVRVGLDVDPISAM